MSKLRFSITESENLSFDDTSYEVQQKKITKKKSIFSDKELENITFYNKLENLENEMQKQIKVFKSCIKELRQSYQQDIIKLRKMKRHKENTSNTGFNKKLKLPDEFCSLIHVEKNTYMTMPEFTKCIFTILKERNLYYNDDKRIFRTDEELSKIFEIDISVNDSTQYPDKNGFNIRTIQKYITNAYKKYTL